MSDAQKGNFQELRKIYPRMGKKWEKDEDERLQDKYREFKLKSGEDFDLFLAGLVQAFGRASGGLKARLAMHFDDVPGWDYERTMERDEWRRAQKSKQSEAVVLQFGAGKVAKLLEQYESYVQDKRETFRKFVLRMSHSFEDSRKIITQVLEQNLQSIIKYNQEDLTPKFTRKKVQEGVAHIDFSGNPEALLTLQLLNETHDNLFLTGEAGTGKSTLLQYFRGTTKKNVVVLAPTGVAALNVGGQTIHSFCAFGPDITLQKVKKLGSWSPKKKLLAKVDTIVIDEISMVRADLLDCVDKFLQLNSPRGHQPFGGFQMVFIGDLFQLPPVEKDFPFSPPPHMGEGRERARLFGQDDSGYASPYFFSSKAFRESEFHHIQLQTIYRQQDEVFINVLNAVRNNVVSSEHLRLLNSRALEEGQDKFTFEQFAIYLTPTNARARQVNNYFLERINSPLKTYSGRASGTFEDRELPTDLQLQIKVGAQVMMLNNDSRKRWVNGTMGKIVGISSVQQDFPPPKRAVPFGSPPLGEMSRFETERVGMGRGGLPAIALATEGGEVLAKHGFNRSNLSYQEVNATRPTSISYEPIEDGEFVNQDNEPISDSDSIIVELETGETVYVEPYTWEMFKFVLDKETQSIDSEPTGSFTQYPFKLAWAVTIHKAQGKTFNKVYIDLATGTFAHGQLYVALSRCRTLEGISLRRPISPKDIILDPRVVEFIKSISAYPKNSI